jgi:DNA-directed RNA polymerase alpha subunit
MKKATETKVKRPNKKVLIAEIEKMGIDQKITNSLARANIETIEFVKGLLQS